jgi:hypothetical protein
VAPPGEAAFSCIAGAHCAFLRPFQGIDTKLLRFICLGVLSFSVHPVLHSIRVGIWLGPVTALLVACNTVTILLYLPVFFVNALYTILITGFIGPNLKIIALVFLPLVVALAPVVTVAGSVVFGIGCTIVMAWSTGCDANCAGQRAFSFAAESCADFWCVLQFLACATAYLIVRCQQELVLALN